jgi:hypothetical protein
MSCKTNIHQERICGALLHLLLLAGLFAVFAHAARPQDSSHRVANRASQQTSTNRVNEFPVQR